MGGKNYKSCLNYQNTYLECIELPTMPTVDAVVGVVDDRLLLSLIGLDECPLGCRIVNRRALLTNDP